MDDIVTRGATILGAASVVMNSIPLVTTTAFAAMRTMSKQDVVSIFEPVVGRIHVVGDRPKRDP